MRIIRQLVLACLSMTVLGCTATQSLSIDRAHLSRQLAHGDRVEVVTKHGAHLKFVIESVDTVGLRGAGQQVVYEDIQSLRRTRVSVVRTALVALGAAAVIEAVASNRGGIRGDYY